ncbi:NUDIX hydrolase N-terminal domain-containing protein [Leeuwenhoekiella blandensis]|uniref:Mutator MutT protein n=1 Tax=Leeuwenhoekiella blandensis (strain CECT 7118 / CCUG 51940 / KCTC 22103 / MED217) TaxID=398720 RepID=A3XGG5_LEEBM|nr:NUDIX hydrolase [Leeuwenhoekiella blandensis]EAQ50786.1 mutator MutT protein [Leeuwenhoekiella blandensis MED217]
MSISENLLNQVKQIKSLAEAGLVYNKENYDAERYEELRALALEMMSILSDLPVEQLTGFFLPETDYPTAKVDVRGLILNAEGEVLLVKETVDGKWTLPGGWADVGLTPTENVLKEIEEETGFKAEVKRLLAVLDKRNYAHPLQPHYVYKLCYLCEITAGDFAPNFDIGEVNWFALDALPELSEDRILEEQLSKLVAIAKGNEAVFSD